MAKKTEVSAVLLDCGIDAKALNNAINSRRKGRTADSANAEDQFDALKKYAQDLTEIARSGKLDPVLGVMKKSAVRFRFCHVGQKIIPF